MTGAVTAGDDPGSVGFLTSACKDPSAAALDLT